MGINAIPIIFIGWRDIPFEILVQIVENYIRPLNEEEKDYDEYGEELRTFLEKEYNLHLFDYTYPYYNSQEVCLSVTEPSLDQLELIENIDKYLPTKTKDFLNNIRIETNQAKIHVVINEH